MPDALTGQLVRTLALGAPLPKAGSEALDAAAEKLRADRLPLALLPQLPKLAQRSRFGELVVSEMRRHAEQITAYREIAKAWESDEIDAVLIKSPGYFPYTSSNVDVLVSAERGADATHTLERLGYAEIRLAREPFKKLFRRIEDPHLGFAVHVHTAVAWISQFLPGSKVLADRRAIADDDLIQYPSPDHVFLITTAHWLYEDKQLTARDVLHVWRASLDGVDWRAVFDEAKRAGWQDGFDLALHVYAHAARLLELDDFGASIERPRALRPRLGVVAAHTMTNEALPLSIPRWTAKRLQLEKTVNDPRLGAASRALEMARLVRYAVRAKRPTIRRGPFVAVAVSGPDGAGKTTLAQTLHEHLCREIGVTASYGWIRAGSSPTLDVLRAPARRAFGLGADGARARATARPSSTVARAWGGVVLADVLVRLWLRRLRARAHGGIHLLDRDAVDAAVDLETMYGIRLARQAMKLAPRPDVQLVLVPPHNYANGARATLPQADRYEPYAASADDVIRERRELDDLVRSSARLVLHSYVRA